MNAILVGTITSISLLVVNLGYWLSGYQVNDGRWISAVILPLAIGFLIGKIRPANKVLVEAAAASIDTEPEEILDPSQNVLDEVENLGQSVIHNVAAIKDVREAIVTIGNNARNVNIASKERIQTMDGVVEKAMGLKTDFSTMVSQTSENLDQLGKTDGKLGRIKSFVEDGLVRTKTNVSTAEKLKAAASEFSKKFEAIDDLATTI